jgi:hypothetical protein
MQDKKYWIEHKIRSLIARGLKPSKAIKRALGIDNPDIIKSLSSLWEDGEFSVVISSDADVWAEAYAGIRSCMQGKGELCRKAYSPFGVQIAVAVRNGKPIARCLVREGKFPKQYGEAHFALAAYLEIVEGMQHESILSSVESASCAVTERKTVVVEKEYTLIDARLVEVCMNFEDVKKYSPTKYYFEKGYTKSWKSYKDGTPYWAVYSKPVVKTVKNTVSETVVVFKPFVDFVE